MVYKAIQSGKSSGMQALKALLQKSRTIPPWLAGGWLAGLSTSVLLALAPLPGGTAQAQTVAKPPAEAAPQAVPGFWDPRRRPDRPDLSRAVLAWLDKYLGKVN